MTELSYCRTVIEHLLITEVLEREWSIEGQVQETWMITEDKVLEKRDTMNLMIVITGYESF